ncbi:SRPBCC family protein [Candidatus Nitrosocosmicus franklandus]|nr:SRPBCC family protein [Candidatus Nitrosocosmicus franklandus]
MINTQNKSRNVKKIESLFTIVNTNRNTIAMTVTMSSFSLLIVLFAVLNTAVITAYGQQTDTINASKIVNASKDKVWEIVSDVDQNQAYWPITILKSIEKTKNTIERDVTVPAPPFMDNKAHQTITLNPEQFTIIENQTQGAVTGVKTISLVQPEKENNNNVTEIRVVWNLDLSKVPGIGQGFAKNGISNSVTEALDKIAIATTKDTRT